VNILEADHISFSYPESVSPVLREITFSVSPGELIGLAGPSGSGKTTLLKHLNGLLRPTRGRILFHGEDTGRRGFRISALRRRVGLVFQYPEQQLFKKTVLEDVSFGPVNLGDSSEEAAAAAREALALMNLGGEYENRSPLELSGGEMRLAAIAGVLAMRPEVLVLDEPAAGLGGLAKTRLMKHLRRLRDETGIAILLVSHSMEDLAEYTDRLLVLSEGALLYDAPPAQVFQETDRMRAIGIGVPTVTSAAEELRRRGLDIPVLPVRTEQAVSSFADLLGGGRHGK